MKRQNLKRKLKHLLRLEPVECGKRLPSAYVSMPNELLFPEVIRYIEMGKTVTIPLKGNSMRPFLCHQRDNALLCRCDKPRVGNPVLAEVTPNKYVLHRIVAINGDHVTLRGDGNLGVEYCRLSDVKALAYGFLRKGRTTPDLISHRKWRVYSWLWMRLLPVRRPLLHLHHLFFRSLKVLD